MKIIVKCEDRYPFFTFEKATDEQVRLGYVVSEVTEEEAEAMTKVMIAFDQMQDTLEELDEQTMKRIADMD